MTVETALEVPSVRRLPYAFAKRHRVLLVEQEGQPLCQYVAPANPAAVAEVQRVFGGPVSLQAVADEAFQVALQRLYENREGGNLSEVEGLGEDLDLAAVADALPETEDLLEQEDDAPIVKLINAIFAESLKQGASDIHIETFEKRLVVRFRVDGVLREVLQPRRALAPLLASRIKVMAKLDIAEKRIPQDGRISLLMAGREVDVRVSTMPSSAGERVVMRLLDKQAGKMDLAKLGMAAEDLRVMTDLLAHPHGIILVTGPTGSGKTTTLYAGLGSINSREKNILTVEDPVEYNLEGIGQTQVNTKADMTFARGLRAILRQDPDVVMVGEIRDLETMQIAIQASLTGHLVLSTLHTNTALGAVTRLVDMGIEPFLLSSSLIGVLAQRLVRVLCPQCRQPHRADESEQKVLGVDAQAETIIYRPNGCEACSHSGYVGRIGIYELVPLNETMRQLIHDRASESKLVVEARKLGPSIRDDGIAKVLAGRTSLEEVLRVTQES
ncbi:type II secretion system ATPase GspE [Microbulbifer sp. 2205BS26-8]|uniref:type II secretion system ATPase GspE n=1 Tax=Microbulbifer sp. 2205BS26-8 TaxID=3064386 RepID=UPI00273F35F1|nr:type II secretion system ATPase GspE [Microbulbifer sp. 2205BS26-8]MDP5209063.1 type II secretion system ATPase GspE [Microbulbifer sp. 2205BS26-8]